MTDGLNGEDGQGEDGQGDKKVMTLDQENQVHLNIASSAGVGLSSRSFHIKVDPTTHQKMRATDKDILTAYRKAHDLHLWIHDVREAGGTVVAIFRDGTQEELGVDEN